MPVMNAAAQLIDDRHVCAERDRVEKLEHGGHALLHWVRTGQQQVREGRQAAFFDERVVGRGPHPPAIVKRALAGGGALRFIAAEMKIGGSGLITIVPREWLETNA
ncbi:MULTISPECIES: hypothetical protein [unclassified Mesorhizobium]|uniref:hypothetical protein n=1 Tax=unclassified Mesorhizobium TaxID=325217 RepID=UPI00333BE024